MRRVASGLDMRYCPSCHVPILKQGGCNRMTCECGHCFPWSSALPVAPCRHAHYGSDDDSGLWGYTCPGCSARAKAELALTRTALVGVGAPLAGAATAVGASVAASAAAVGLVVAVAPAALFGPLALAYEPVRRLARAKRNPFAKPAKMGAYVAAGSLGLCVMAACGYESD